MTDPVTRLNAALKGRYAIERELGEGGMATVYLADDRRVAVRPTRRHAMCFGSVATRIFPAPPIFSTDSAPSLCPSRRR